MGEFLLPYDVVHAGGRSRRRPVRVSAEHPRYPVGPGSRRKGFVFDSEMLIECGLRKFESLAVRVPAIYDTVRASHFRPVADIAQIVIMVAAHLLRRGMYLPGLVRSLRQQQRVLSEPAP